MAASVNTGKMEHKLYPYDLRIRRIAIKEPIQNNSNMIVYQYEPKTYIDIIIALIIALLRVSRKDMVVILGPRCVNSCTIAGGGLASADDDSKSLSNGTGRNIQWIVLFGKILKPEIFPYFIGVLREN